MISIIFINITIIINTAKMLIKISNLILYNKYYRYVYFHLYNKNKLSDLIINNLIINNNKII